MTSAFVEMADLATVLEQIKQLFITLSLMDKMLSLLHGLCTLS